jgi:hypothetical protein
MGPDRYVYDYLSILSGVAYAWSVVVGITGTIIRKEGKQLGGPRLLVVPTQLISVA